MTLRTLEPITMQLRLSEPLRLFHQEKGRSSGKRASSQFIGRLSDALRLEQEVGKAMWLSLALAI